MSEQPQPDSHQSINAQDTSIERSNLGQVIGGNLTQIQGEVINVTVYDKVDVPGLGGRQTSSSVHALNQFIQEHGQTEMVVCSRIRDYEALSARLKLQGAICIQSLTPEQINQYLERAGTQLEAVKTVLQEDTALQELAKSPLTLSVMTLAYQGISIEDLPNRGSVEEHHQHLFNAYIERMFKRRGASERYSKAQAMRWLTWLAKMMSQKSQTVFLIERMQPTWLQTKVQIITYRIGGILLSGLLGLMIDWLNPISLLAITVFIVFLIERMHPTWLQTKVQIITYRIGGILLSGLIGIIVYGLSPISSLLGIYDGLICGLICGLGRAEIRTIETFQWSWKKARMNLINGLTSGLILGLVILPFIGLMLWKIGDGRIGGEPMLWLLWLMIRWLNLGISFGLIFVLIRGLKGSEIEAKTIPNQGIKRSILNALVVGLLVGAIVGFIILPVSIPLVVGRILGVSVGLIFGLIIGGLIIGGGKACIQHFSLRLILYYKGFIPWNYARFLDYATDRIFLQKVGGGYIFIHRLLLEHFAQMEPEQVCR